ncbi:MAG: LysM domain protein, Peptidoglycan-binding protein [Candidatus Giovannonibacteria bacterium GW2011_GWA2_44_26]|uniref:LysM domain protein, Peptidoglycan-binding protein n=1 Tax=Candidatus Giovannonibacteria bacterium GW2011_GWA2_44_26 TaxID=1618648 RepID=A0A0G1L1J4_9BACT|nr:MAG: LysM domain protein, Peptidoglycan-binding protein [Candidatus Giovannonibacteria bacterium GW2011_GWA2_44_26]
MATITIQKGQTLSGIAKQQGTTVDALLKANPSIKNPNLIYAGSALSLPEAPKPTPVAPGASGSAPITPVTPPTPVTTRVDQISSPGASPVPAKNTLYGADVPSSTSLLEKYRSDLGLNTALKSMQDSQTSYLDTLKNLPKKSDLYKTERTTRGIDQMQTNLQSLDDRLAKMDEAINASEKDIRDRTIQSGGLVTESQTQRLVASEKNPLIDEYRKLLSERNQLANKLGVADASAKDAAGMAYDDSTLPLNVAEKTLGFQKDQYSVLGNLLSQVFGASEKDVANIIDAAKYGKEQEKKNAQEVIDRAIKLANLANDTPSGQVFDIAGTKVVGTKKASSSGDGGSASDVEAYALELLNNPNFTASNVPQNIRAQVLQKRDQIIAETNTQQQADAQAAEALKASQPKITAQQFGSGVKDVFTQKIPSLAKSGYNTSKNFFKGLFGIGN